MIVIINSSSSLFQGAYLLGIKLVFIWHCFAFVFFWHFYFFFLYVCFVWFILFRICICIYKTIILWSSLPAQHQERFMCHCFPGWYQRRWFMMPVAMYLYIVFEFVFAFVFVFVFVYIWLLFCEEGCSAQHQSGLCVIVFQVDTNSGDSWWSLVPGICNFYLYLYSVHCIWICICTCKCICIVFVTLEVDNNPYMILPLARYIISTHKQLSIAAIAFLREQHQSYQKEKNLTPAKAVWRDICTPLFMYFPSTQQYLLPRPTKHFLSQVAYFSLDHLYLLPTFKWTTWIGNSWVWLFWVILSYAVFIFVYPAS